MNHLLKTLLDQLQKLDKSHYIGDYEVKPEAGRTFSTPPRIPAPPKSAIKPSTPEEKPKQ